MVKLWSVSTNDRTPPPIKITTGHLQQVQRKVQDNHNDSGKARNTLTVATTDLMTSTKARMSENSLKLKK